jgi:hypothetical protein
MDIQEADWPEPKSPRDFRPWETLDFLPDGCFLYQQAAREIADSLSWSDAKLEALLETMAEAINSKALPTVSRKTGLRLSKTNAPEFLGVVNVADVNEWLNANGATYCWNRDAQSLTRPDKGTANQPKNIQHSTKTERRSTLKPVIEHAQSLCKDPWDTAEVWGQLHTLTAQKHTVLLHLEDDAVVYMDGDNTKKLTRKNLGERLVTARKKLDISV